MGNRGRRGVARATGLLLAGLVAGALVLGGPQAAGTRTSAVFDGAKLSVTQASFVGHKLLSVDVSLQSALSGGEAPGIAASVDLYVPAGVQFDLSQAPGSEVGQLSAAIASAADGSGFTFVNAVIVVDDPARYVSDPLAQSCAPGGHGALWRAALSLFGQEIAIPIAIDATGSGGSAAYRIRLCPFRAPSASLPAGVAFLQLGLAFIDQAAVPTAPGLYTWSALVTPASQFVADPTRAFELRAIVPVPQTLSLSASYDSKTRSATFSGKLTAAATPRAGAVVRLVGVTGKDRFEDLGKVTTDAAGAFRVRRSVGETTRVSASVEEAIGPCSAPSTAPGGCLSETESSPLSASTTVIVPRRTDPKQAIRPRDQALASRAILAGADLPGDWQAVADSTGPCVGFAPNLHKLTLTGQAFSRFFAAPDQNTVAESSAGVYATTADATTAFARVAQAAAAKCEAADAVDGTAGTPAPLPFPRVGNATRAYRVIVTISEGVVNVDLIFVRVGRVVMELDVYALGLSEEGLEVALARKIASRARGQKP